jgi:VanZ family protein
VRWYRIALVAYWIALFAATHYPRIPIPGEVPHGDKLVHFTAFGLLAFLFRKAVPLGVWPSAAILIAYAALDEWLQQFVGRFTDPIDFVANAAGIVTVLVVLQLRRR